MGFYSAGNNPQPNVNLNPLGSQFASDFGHEEQQLLERVFRKEIYEADPKQFVDLALFNQLARESRDSDEVFWDERTTLGSPIVASGATGGVTAPSTQTFAIADTALAAKNVIIVYSNNAKGVIQDVDTTAGTITVAPQSGSSLPDVSIGDKFAHLGNIESNRQDGFDTYYKDEYIQKHNYIQSIAYAIEFTEKEMYKWERSGRIENYIGKRRDAMMQFFRTRLSNILWNGTKGEMIVNGQNEKTTGGIFPTLVEEGAPSTSTAASNIAPAFEDIATSLNKGAYGSVKLAFMSPKHHLALSKEYKSEKIRYTAESDTVTNLMLDMVKLGDVDVVMVPYSRFKDENAFPESFQDRIVFVDPMNIKLNQMWGERQGQTLSRKDGIAKNYSSMWVETQLGVEIQDAAGTMGYIDLI